MARKPRVEFHGAFYHVISRGNQRRALFLDRADRAEYLRRLETYRRRYNFVVYAYVLMRNHVHLLMETGQVPLSKIMQGLQFTYTRYFNRKYGKVGHLFQGRYKALLCDRDAYLLELVRYLHLNPARTRRPENPLVFEWSSHRSYLGDSGPVEVEISAVLGQFHRSLGASRRAYGRYLREGLAHGHQAKYYSVVDQRFLGDNRFVETVARRVGNDRDVQEAPLRVGLGPLIEAVADVCGVSAHAIRDRTYGRREGRARRLFVEMAREHSRIKAREVAAFLGRDATQISHLKREYRDDPDPASERAVLERLNSHA